MFHPTIKREVKPLLKLLITSLILSPFISFSQIDTAKLGKEISDVLKKYGLKNASFELSVKSTKQTGGQTAFVINNYNGNITMVSDVSYAEYAKLDMTGLAFHAGYGLIGGDTELSALMKHVVKFTSPQIEIMVNDTALRYTDSVIKKFPHFPYSYYCKAVILATLNTNLKESVISAEKAVEIFEITTKIEGHFTDQDRALIVMQKLINDLNKLGY